MKSKRKSPPRKRLSKGRLLPGRLRRIASLLEILTALYALDSKVWLAQKASRDRIFFLKSVEVSHRNARSVDSTSVATVPTFHLHFFYIFILKRERLGIKCSSHVHASLF